VPPRIIFRATGRLQLELPGLVHDAHAAAAEHRFHVVTRDVGKLTGRFAAPRPGGLSPTPRAAAGRREHGVDLGVELAEPLQALANSHSSSGESAQASSGVRPDSRISSQQPHDPRVGHMRSSFAYGDRRLLPVPRWRTPGFEVSQLVRQEEQAAVESALDRLGGHAEDGGGLRLVIPWIRTRLNTSAPLPGGFDHVQDPPRVGADLRRAAVRRGRDQRVAQLHRGRLFI
jgi:hypothetical protein